MISLGTGVDGSVIGVTVGDLVPDALGHGVGEVVLGVPVGIGVGAFVPATLGNGVGEVVLGVPVGIVVGTDVVGNAGALAGLDVGDGVCDASGDSVGNSVIVLVPTTA